MGIPRWGLVSTQRRKENKKFDHQYSLMSILFSDTRIRSFASGSNIRGRACSAGLRSAIKSRNSGADSDYYLRTKFTTDRSTKSELCLAAKSCQTDTRVSAQDSAKSVTEYSPTGERSTSSNATSTTSTSNGPAISSSRERYRQHSVGLPTISSSFAFTGYGRLQRRKTLFPRTFRSEHFFCRRAGRPDAAFTQSASAAANCEYENDRPVISFLFSNEC